MDSHRKAILLNVEEIINCISDCANHYCNFRFKILPEDFEKYPEIKNNFDIIVKKIDGIKDYIYKNTHDSFRKKKNNITKMN